MEQNKKPGGFLCLQRRAGEEIVIGDESVIVHVVRIVNGQVTIGISCSKDLSIHRREIFDEIKKTGGNLLGKKPRP